MNVLFLSHLYATPADPYMGMPNAKIVKALKNHANVLVVSPKPHFRQRYPRFAAVETDPAGIKVYRPSYLHVPKLGALISPMTYQRAAMGSIGRLKNHFAPDIILASWAYPDGVAAARIGQLLNVPVAVCVLGCDINDYGKKPWLRFHIRRGLNRVQGIISVSQALAQRTFELGITRPEITVIPNGINTRLFSPRSRQKARSTLQVSEQHKLLVVASRLSQEKGIDVLIDALGQLRKSPSSCTPRVLIFGEGEEHQNLENQIRQEGLGDQISLLKFHPPEYLASAFSAADLTILPSHREGWPNVLVEALACGCPFVASEVGGIPEILRAAGDAGLMFQPGNSADLAANIRQGLERQWDRREIADTAKKTFDLDLSVVTYFETLKRWVARGRG